MLQVGQSPVPGYKLEKFLGRGNFGEVWQSTSPGGTKSALKFLNLAQKQGRKEFRAIQKLKQIRHANLMPINAMWLLDQDNKVIPDEYLDTDFDLMPDTLHQTMAVTLLPPNVQPSMLVIAMPQAELNLLELLRDYQLKHPGDGLPVGELLDYMRDAAKAIDFLNSPRHDVGDGVVSFQHSDVKPENLMLMGGSVLLCDFGVAKTLTENSDMRATSMGGSLAYISPESLNGTPSNYSDQFSLAVSYLELRTGELPFETHTMQQVINDRSRGAIDLSKLPPQEAKVVQRALSVKPDLRFPNTVHFVEALRVASVPLKKKSPLPAVALVAALAAGAAVIPFVINRDDDQVIIEKDPEKDPLNNQKDPVDPVSKEGQEERRKALEQIEKATLGSTELVQATKLYVQSLKKGIAEEYQRPTISNLIPLTQQDRSFLRDSFAYSPNHQFAWISGEGNTVSVSHTLLGDANNIQIPNQVYNLSWIDDNTMAILAKGDSDSGSKVIYYYRTNGSLVPINGQFDEMCSVGGICYAIAGNKLQKISRSEVVESFDLESDQAGFSKTWQSDSAVAYQMLDSSSFLPITPNGVLPALSSKEGKNVELATLMLRKESEGELTPFLILTKEDLLGPFVGIFQLVADSAGKTQWKEESIDVKSLEPLTNPRPFSIEVLPSPEGDNGILLGHEDGNVTVWTRNNEGMWALVEQYITDGESEISAVGSFIVDVAGSESGPQKYIVCGNQAGAVFLIKRSGKKDDPNIRKIADFGEMKLMGGDSFDEPKTIFTDDRTLALQFKDGVIATWPLPHCVMVFEASLQAGEMK